MVLQRGASLALIQKLFCSATTMGGGDCAKSTGGIQTQLTGGVAFKLGGGVKSHWVVAIAPNRAARKVSMILKPLLAKVLSHF